MQSYVVPCGLEQLRHLRLCQPYGLIFHPYIQRQSRIRLIKDYFIFFIRLQVAIIVIYFVHLRLSFKCEFNKNFGSVRSAGQGFDDGDGLGLVLGGGADFGKADYAALVDDYGKREALLTNQRNQI